LEWVKEALKLSHKEEKDFHHKIVKSFQLKLDELQTKIDKAYEDKLEGKIPEELWASKFRQWVDQKENLQIQLNAHQRANKSYYESGVKILELSNRAYELYEKQDVKEKQKLLKFLLSNSKMQGNTVDFVLKMPFCLIVKTKESENWLGWLDSSHYSLGLAMTKSASLAVPFGNYPPYSVGAPGCSNLRSHTHKTKKTALLS
ncbi:hypothetical protein DID80_07010, partial [Candidatus Marinamargulisbacteria bacterium SCGC AAA071-K20]